MLLVTIAEVSPQPGAVQLYITQAVSVKHRRRAHASARLDLTVWTAVTAVTVVKAQSLAVQNKPSCSSKCCSCSVVTVSVAPSDVRDTLPITGCHMKSITPYYTITAIKVVLAAVHIHAKDHVFAIADTVPYILSS